MERALTKKVVGYLLWALVLAGLLIGWKFPYGSVRQRLDAAAREQLGLRFEITDVSFTLPPSVKLEKCTVRSTAPGSKVFLAATELYLRLKLLPLLKGSLALALRSQIYGGVLEGDIRLKPIYDVRQYQLRLRGQGLRLDDQTDISALLNRQLSGKISGDLEFQGDFGDIFNSTGGGKLQLEEGGCPIDSPYLTTKFLEGLEISTAFTLSGGTLTIETCQFKGSGFQGSLNGEVNLQPRLPDSTLKLEGKSQIDPGMVNLPPDKRRVAAAFLDRGNPVPFKVRGTIEAPQLRLF
jgi:type II secretion system protein N